MKLGYPRHGLRVTVRLHGTVVSQRVLWAPPVGELLSLSLAAGALCFLFGRLASNDITLLGLWSPLLSQLAVLLLFPTGVGLALASLLWRRRVAVGAGRDAVPTPDGGAPATVIWAPGRPPELVPADAAAGRRPMEPGSRWAWRAGDVELLVDALDRQPARRLPTDPLGDIGLVVVALSLYVGILQVRTLVQVLPGQGTAVDDGYQMSPELIARLLQRDFEGADEGVEPRADRPELPRQVDGVYLPAGSEGPLVRVGGGATQGDHVMRTDPLDDPEPEPEPASLADADGESLALEATTDLPEDVAGQARQAPDRHDDSDRGEELARRLPAPMERFIGWGFRDWMDASQRQDRLDPRARQEIELARARLRIDPDDPGALQVVGHYAYLAEDFSLCRSAYQRLTELYPDFAAGYNNLALTYKRQGDYATEEALYRKALALEPNDPVVLNNLAIALAHQQRYEEALAIMALLEEIDPDDPYSELHRAKIYAAMGKRERAYRALRRALAGVDRLDTLHHIEFRQDLRVEPLLDSLRGEARFRRLIERTYGAESQAILAGASGGSRG
ncbi:MAG: tetratricopeptide repeat protein [Deltaproteobacteria bacterium]|nr:MAG: tetratricopeptide repeat protein [Deltaproteobacteria bacterium]